MSEPLFERMALIGIGLIGASLALAARRRGLARRVVTADCNPDHVRRAQELGLVDEASTDLGAMVDGADLVVLCTPVGSFAALAAALAPHLAPGAIVSDVGSVKELVLREVAPRLPAGVQLVPAHPVAGTEFSGPDAGKADLFEGRWCILTPPDAADALAVARVRALWEGVGSMVEVMEASHHDRVLAITSHLPHLIAYTIVDTAVGLEESTQSEVIKFSASGFRDFTRIAASDPVMWRDIFLNNREAVLDILQRFTEDLTALQRAIRRGEGETLQRVFTSTRKIRRSIIDARQA
ncbi:MAG: prephenate/arogenate dehydrogenase family protein [Rhodospirillaceae bacterium]